MSTEQKELYERILLNCPEAAMLRGLSTQFREAMTDTTADRLQDWINRAKTSEFGPVVRFAYGLQKDVAAVRAAVETPWSTGQVEGQINRLKMIKRQMYGRAGFRLLRARVLPFGSRTAGPAP